MKLGIEELRQFLLEGKELTSLLEIPSKILSFSFSTNLNKFSPLNLIRLISPQTAELVEFWLRGEKFPAKPEAVDHIRPISPLGKQIPSYIEWCIEETKPDLILFDTPPFLGLGAGIVHALSIHNFLGLPLTIAPTNQEGMVLDRGRSYFSGSALETVIIISLLKKIPLVPVGMPFQPLNTRSSQIFQQLLDKVYEEFDSQLLDIIDKKTFEKGVKELESRLWNSGLPLSEERGAIVNECCYLASRVRDALGFFTKRKRQVKTLLFVDLKLSRDLPEILRLLDKDKIITSEFYLSPQREDMFYQFKILTHNIKELYQEAQVKTPETTLAQQLFKKEFQNWLIKKRRTQISLEEADALIARLLEAVRNHPLIERGAGVRASLSLRDIAQGYALMKNGKITYQTIEKAALIALPHRLLLKPGKEEERREVVKKIVTEVLYGLGLTPKESQLRSGDQRLTKESLKKILEGLCEVTFKRLDELEKGIPDFDQSLAEEIMNHPLIQETLKNFQIPEEALLALKKLLKELDKHEVTNLLSPNRYSLTERGTQLLSEILNEKLARGEITPEEIEQIIKKAKRLSSAKGIQVEVSKDRLTSFVAELMDVQHQGRSKETSLEDVYVHYTLNEKKGVKTEPEKLDYQKLQMMIHELEKRGLVRSDEKKKSFTLTAQALTWLLDELIPRTQSEPLLHSAFKKEHETDKAEVRRYRKGDVFRDISVRHTLREIVKKGKTLDEICEQDFRSFEKKRSFQLDIALCIDVSASMKDQYKLRYAKMALAGLIKAALEKHDRVGIVAFSNRGEVVAPLTDKLHPLLEATVGLRAEQYTNIGNGLRCAREMLMKAKDGNKKYIILITDGQPNAATPEDIERQDLYIKKRDLFSSDEIYWNFMMNAFKGSDWKKREELGTSYALTEAFMCRDKDIKISTLLITPKDQQGEWLAKRIATIGGGRYYKVKTPENLVVDALNIVQ